MVYEKMSNNTYETVILAIALKAADMLPMERSDHWQYLIAFGNI